MLPVCHRAGFQTYSRWVGSGISGSVRCLAVHRTMFCNFVQYHNITELLPLNSNVLPRKSKVL